MVVRESVLSISLSDLRSIGLFNKDNWSKWLPVVLKKNNETYYLWIVLKSNEGYPSIELNYVINGEDVKYQIPLVQVPNQLTGGFSYYFQCAATGRKCRKLFLNGLYFQHSSNIKGLYYLHDTLPVSRRLEYRNVKGMHTIEKTISNRSKRYFKSHYAGQLTQKQKGVMAAFKQLQKIA